MLCLPYLERKLETSEPLSWTGIARPTRWTTGQRGTGVPRAATDGARQGGYHFIENNAPKCEPLVFRKKCSTIDEIVIPLPCVSPPFVSWDFPQHPPGCPAKQMEIPHGMWLSSTSPLVFAHRGAWARVDREI